MVSAILANSYSNLVVNVIFTTTIVILRYHTRHNYLLSSSKSNTVLKRIPSFSAKDKPMTCL